MDAFLLYKQSASKLEGMEEGNYCENACVAMGIWCTKPPHAHPVVCDDDSTVVSDLTDDTPTRDISASSTIDEDEDDDGDHILNPLRSSGNTTLREPPPLPNAATTQSEQTIPSIRKSTSLRSARRNRLDRVRLKALIDYRTETNVQLQCTDFGEMPRLRYHESPVTSLESETTTSLFDYVLSGSLTVAVEATHISPVDIMIRKGGLGEHDASICLPYTMGTNLIGVVHEGPYKGQRVATLSKAAASNAKYTTVPSSCVLPVPKDLDAAEMACIVSVYLPCFQALYHGIGLEQGRYGGCNNNNNNNVNNNSSIPATTTASLPSCPETSSSCLENKRILITSGAHLSYIHAMARLCFLAGVQEVYVVAEEEYHKRLFKESQVLPLEFDQIRILDGTVQVLLDFTNMPFSSHHAYAPTLAHGARHVHFRQPNHIRVGSASSHHMTLMSDAFSWDFWEQASMLSAVAFFDDEYLPSIYDMFDAFSADFIEDTTKMDLQFLFELLAKRQLRPEVECFINLHAVEDAHRAMQETSTKAAIICEPWREMDMGEI